MVIRELREFPPKGLTASAPPNNSRQLAQFADHPRGRVYAREGSPSTAASFSNTLSTEAGLAITGTVTLFKKVS